MDGTLTLARADGANMAPMEPLARAASAAQSDQDRMVDATWFGTTKAELERENALTWRNHALLWEMLYLFIEGKHLLRRAKNGTWKAMALPERTDTPVYGYNLAGFYSDGIAAKWTQSKTDVRWRGVGDTDALIGAAHAATSVHEYLHRKLYSESFLQLEAKHAQCGKYARYYYFTDDVKVTGRKEKMQPQAMDFGAGALNCPDCGYSGEVGDNGVSTSDTSGQMGDGGDGGNRTMPCPACGSPYAAAEQVEPLTVENGDGFEPVEMGDIVCETVSAFELKHDLNSLPQDSVYLMRRRRVRVAVMQGKFPFLKINPQRSENAGMQAADNLKYSTYGAVNYTGLGQRGETEREQTVEFIQLWLDPALYGSNVLTADYRTLAGQVVPKGTRLLDLFPSGMYSCWIEGVEGCVELRDEHHRDYWVGQVYRPRVMSAMGSGIEDVIEANRQYDLMMSVIYTQLRTSAMPATLFDERLLPNGVSQYLGSLQNIPVNLAVLEDRRLGDAVHQLMPQPPTPQHFAFADKLNGFMQLASRVTDFSAELGINQDTLGGAQIAQSLSQSLFGPQLALKADMDRRGAEVLLKLWRRFVPFERYVALAGKRGKQEGLWLSGLDVAQDLQAEVVPDSFLPQTSLERRQRWQALLLDIGGLPGLKLAQSEMPQLLEELTDMYDVDLGAEDYTAISELCRRRVEQMKQAMPMWAIVSQAMPPTPRPVGSEAALGQMAEVGQFLLGILQPAIEVEEFGHLAAINWCRSWLTEDEGLEAPPELRAGVKAMLAAHLDGLMTETQITGAMQMAGQSMPAQPEDAGNSATPARQASHPDKRQQQSATRKASPARQPMRMAAIT